MNRGPAACLRESSDSRCLEIPRRDGVSRKNAHKGAGHNACKIRNDCKQNVRFLHASPVSVSEKAYKKGLCQTATMSETFSDQQEMRRRFIAGISVVSIGSFAPAAAESTSANRSVASSEYLLAPGLIHLNTASLGAIPKVVLDRTLAAWRELESSPVLMAHGKDENTVSSAAERVRDRAATLLGCDPDELLITRGTTDAMRWSAGERVLTTNREHDGGGLCWTYVAQRHGVIVDRIAISLDEHDSAAIVERFAAAITPATRRNCASSARHPVFRPLQSLHASCRTTSIARRFATQSSPGIRSS